MRSWLRADLLIAVCALLISSLTCVATFFQTRVIANQLSASVWPYLSFTRTFDPGGLTLTVDNEGLGPALIRSASLSVDGRPMASWESAAKQLGPIRDVTLTQASFSSLGPGAVIRAGDSHRLFHLALRVARNAPPGAAVAHVQRWFEGRAEITICYCSTLENCWLMRSGDDEEPAPLGRCPDKSEIGA